MKCDTADYFKAVCNASGTYPCTLYGPYTDASCTDEAVEAFFSVPLGEGDCDSSALINPCSAVFQETTNWWPIITVVVVCIIVVAAVGAVIAVLAVVKLGIVKVPFNLPPIMLPAESGTAGEGEPSESSYIAVGSG